MSTLVDEKKIEEILTRSVSRIYPTPEALATLLRSGRPLRVYHGIDPTATAVHLGHATNYLILKRLQEMGHKIIVLIGDFTAQIGDPSDKSAARRRLTAEEVKTNFATFKEQIGKILDFDHPTNPVELRFNSEWLARLSLVDLVELAAHFTVQQMIERDNFSKRLKEKKPLYVHEFFYPLLQGYDSVALVADLEIGGTDQTFNMLAGRTLVKDYQGREKIVLTTTLLEHPVTKEKLMSKSLGTGIGLNESPTAMFGQVMALPDEAIIQCFTDCTTVSLPTIKKLADDLDAGANPRDVKMRLAEEIVALYHHQEAAAEARADFVATFQQKELPAVMAEARAVVGTPLGEILLAAGVVESKSDYRRLISEGAISVFGGEKISDPATPFQGEMVLKIGKRRFIKILPQ